MTAMGSLFGEFFQPGIGASRKARAFAFLVAKGDRLTIGELKKAADDADLEMHIQVHDKKKKEPNDE